MASVERKHDPGRRSGILARHAWLVVLAGFLVIAGALLFTEHRAHVLGILIYLPLLACPLMHLFMHGGHGGHGGHSHSRQDVWVKEDRS
jgi:Protein of unknown function (DUF2933)